jgi:hypothetical protein
MAAAVDRGGEHFDSDNSGQHNKSTPRGILVRDLESRQFGRTNRTTSVPHLPSSLPMQSQIRSPENKCYNPCLI